MVRSDKRSVDAIAWGAGGWRDVGAWLHSAYCCLWLLVVACTTPITILTESVRDKRENSLSVTQRRKF